MIVPTLLAAVIVMPLAAQAAPECDVVVAFVDFGRLDARDDEAVTGEVGVLCDAPTSFALALSEGLGSFKGRRMHGPGGARLQYNIYLDPGHRRIWGDGVSAGTAMLTGRNNGRRRTLLPVYPLVPRGQSRPAGSYHDTLVVTVER